MTSEVEERIHKTLASHPLERIEGGYRLAHEAGVGASTLRLLPAGEPRDGQQVVAIAEVVAEYGPVGMPSFHPAGLQRLNRMAIYGAYHMQGDQLRQTAQFSIYGKEPSAHLAAQSILNAFGAQLPLGRSSALATVSAAMLEQQRAHHAMPREWKKPVDEQSMQAAAAALQARGLAASNNATSIWAEIAMSGDCPSRSIDPQAETALLQVTTATAHPIAGAGYLATIFLPLQKPPANSDEICRRLNALELEQVEFAPRNGAWGLHGKDDLPGYTCFVPCPEPIDGMHMALMWWCAGRAAWLRDGFWVAQQGIVFDKASDAKPPP